jgi:hypothetical protein
MDIAKKARLLEKVSNYGLNEAMPRGGDSGLPLVSLEDFFEGNGDQQSIAVNLMDQHPGLDFIFSLLKSIRGRPDVADVLVEIYDVEWAISDPTCWPFAEKVVFLTSAAIGDVEQWSDRLRASGPVEGYPQPVAPNAPVLSSPTRAIHVVWD